MLFHIEKFLKKAFSTIKNIANSGVGVIVVFVLIVLAIYSICFLPRPTPPPSILIDDTFYIVSNTTMSEVPANAQYLGRIEKTTSKTKVPSQNFQANHKIKGAEIYLLENGDIIVGIDGTWQRYHKHSD